MAVPARLRRRRGGEHNPVGDNMNDVKYNEEHLWVKIDDHEMAVVGISEHAQEQPGEIREVNEALADSPELINESPLDDGWLVRIESADLSELDELMDEDAYREFVDSET
jgi:glycine cleavage system H lipoate-binding protein